MNSSARASRAASRTSASVAPVPIAMLSRIDEENKKASSNTQVTFERIASRVMLS